MNEPTTDPHTKAGHAQHGQRCLPRILSMGARADGSLAAGGLDPG
jgi:hypothetical protein